MSSLPHDEHKIFNGGVHPEGKKELSSSARITEAPILEKYTVIVHQNIGASPVLTVKKGDIVKKGQNIAHSGGFVSVPLHSPTSGVVDDLTECPGFSGVKMKAVEIKSDGKDEWVSEISPIPDWKNVDPKELRQRISEAGIVGMGGAAFPTHVKISPPEELEIDTLIINGAECEPYLTADHRLMLEKTAEVLEGASIIGRILGVKNIYAGIECNKSDAIDQMKKEAVNFNVNVKSLRMRYPQGAEKQLIYALTGRKVPTGKLPMNVGCVVQNAATAFAVYKAIVLGRPLIERITTITGKSVVNPGNWKLRIGTPVKKAIELAGGVKYPPAKVILGGPMMGFAQKTLDVTIMKNTSGILLLDDDQISQFESFPCIRCGRCVDVCPMKLIPGTMSLFVENEKYDLAEKHYVMNCIECGSCAFVCPANRPLVQHFRRAKAEVNLKNRKK